VPRIISLGLCPVAWATASEGAATVAANTIPMTARMCNAPCIDDSTMQMTIAGVSRVPFGVSTRGGDRWLNFQTRCSSKARLKSANRGDPMTRSKSQTRCGWMLGSLFLAGCGATLPQLQTRAALDLDCHAEALSVRVVDPATRLVTGCGKQAIYVENFNNSRYPAWLLNSEIRPEAPRAVSAR
jgi:hypothetical protein